MTDGSALDLVSALNTSRGYNGYNDEGFGGNWAWILIFMIFAFMGGGFGGFGNGTMQGALTRGELCEGFNFQNLENGVRGIQNGLCDGFYAQNTTFLQGLNSLERGLCQGFGSVTQNLMENRFAAQNCCCETNRNIDAVRYENARNTCDIVQAIKADGDATRALITANVMQELRDNLQSAQLQLSNNSQTQTIINAVRPTPIPAWPTCSPYTAYNFNNGYNGGCGFNF